MNNNMEKGDYVYDPNTGISFILKDFKSPYHGKVFCTSFCAIVEGRLVFNFKPGLINPPFNVNNPEIITEMDKFLFQSGYYFDTEALELKEVPPIEAKDIAKIAEVATEAIKKFLTNKK